MWRSKRPGLRRPGSSVRRVLAPVENAEDGESLLRFLKKQPFPESLEMRVLHVVPVADPLWPLDALQADKHVREAIERSGALTSGIAQREIYRAAKAS